MPWHSQLFKPFSAIFWQSFVFPQNKNCVYSNKKKIVKLISNMVKMQQMNEQENAVLICLLLLEFLYVTAMSWCMIAMGPPSPSPKVIEW